MFSKIYNFWLILKSNLWFLPAMLCMITFAVMIGIFYLEKEFVTHENTPDYLFNIAKDDAKDLVTALLSAMITMATLAISLTMIVLSVAASQLGPRILKTFMGDRTTKYYIGFFFSVVMSCFTLSLILYNTSDYEQSYQFIASFVFFMCFINLFVLLGFLNHVAQSCIADNVVLRLSGELKNAIHRISKQDNEHKISRTTAYKDWPKEFDKKSTPVPMKKTGYVQNINYDDLINFAAQHDIRIRIECESGYYMIADEEKVFFVGNKLDDEAVDDLRDAFMVGNQRTPTQDLEYSIRHMVEIALRALSPGINDSFTAINVIDHLASALAIAFKNENAPAWLADDDGTPRIHVKRDTDSNLIYAAFDQIRHNAQDKPHVLDHMRQKLNVLKNLSQTAPQKKGIEKQIKNLGKE